MAKDDKKKQKLLADQEAQDRARYLQLLDKAETPSPLQQRRETDTLNFLDWESGTGDYKDKPIDVTHAPGLGPALSLYERAKAGQQGERMGTGAIQLGLNASDPGLAANLAEESKLRREQEAAGGLEEAVAAKSAEAHGSALPLIQLNQSRALNLADTAANQSRFSTNEYTQFRPRSPWETVAKAAAGGAAAFA